MNVGSPKSPLKNGLTVAYFVAKNAGKIFYLLKGRKRPKGEEGADGLWYLLSVLQW